VTIFDKTIGPAMQRIGDLSHDGTITIAREHVASQMMLGILSDLLRRAQPGHASRRVALACFADEDHRLARLGVWSRSSARRRGALDDGGTLATERARVGGCLRGRLPVDGLGGRWAGETPVALAQFEALGAPTEVRRLALCVGVAR
jgi:hypothetical protein